MIVDVDARRGDGRAPEGGDYPLVAPADGLDGLLADAAVCLAGEPGPLRIARLERFDQPFAFPSAVPAGPGGVPTGPNAADCVIEREDGSVAFDSRLSGVSYRGSAYGPRLYLHEWSSPDGTVRLVQRRALAPDAVDTRYDPAIDAEATLVASCVRGHAPALQAVDVGELSGSGLVEFEAGYNVDLGLASSVQGLRRVATLTVSVIPGAGDGLYPGCESAESLVRKIGGVGPDERGNVALALDRCLWARPRAEIVEGVPAVVAGYLQIGNDCPPCCECADFVSLKSAIDQVAAGIRAAATSLEDTRDRLAANIERYQAQAACREASAASVSVFTSGSQYADVIVQFCNRGDVCLTGVTATVTLSVTNDAAVEAVANTTVVTDVGGRRIKGELLEDAGAFVHVFDSIDPGRTALFRFRVQVGSTFAGTAITADVRFDAEPAGQVYWLPQTASASDAFTEGTEA